ncbi:MAG: hypothetical protein RR595_04010 [Lysinibacillus sp.]
MKLSNNGLKKHVMRAVVIGGVVGLFGVLAFLGLLQLGLKLTDDEPRTEEKTKPVTTTEDTGSAARLYASQAGVFSNLESANVFLASQPSLKESAVVESDGKFYVWSSVTAEEGELKFLEDPKTFKKEFTLAGKGCSEATLAELPTALSDKKASKFNFKGTKKDMTLPTDWQSIGAAASTISSDESIVRLHILAHYKTKNDCLKINFE